MTGDTVREQASIVFDDNDAIETNIWTNVIDAVGPTTTMDSIPPSVPTDTITLCWSSVDDPGGVGVGNYNLYVSRDSATFYLFEPDIDTTCYLFEGDIGSNYSFYIRAVDLVGNEEAAPDMPQIEVLFGGSVELAVKVFLQGPYSTETGLMNHELQSGGLIPLTEPYGTGKNETTTQAVLDKNDVPEDIIVDWVLIELRDTPTTVVDRRAALVQRDGDVVDLDGVSAVKFTDVDPGLYFVVVRHRNHLGIMTSERIMLGGN